MNNYQAIDKLNFNKKNKDKNFKLIQHLFNQLVLIISNSEIIVS